MKTITPISIWDNGTVQEATVLNAYAINDNLTTSATFYYTISSESMQLLAQGNLTMSGDDYDAWETNNYAYDWVAGPLNLTIIGDYVPPVVEPIEEVVVEPTEPQAEPTEPDSETDTETQPNN
jgi:hypothetical protein